MKRGEATRRPKRPPGPAPERPPMNASAGVDHAVGRIAAFGAFFTLVAVSKIAWAIVVVLRPSAIVSTTGAAANGAIIAVWALSRTIGFPIGPKRGCPSPSPRSIWRPR